VSDYTDTNEKPRDRLAKLGRRAAATADLAVFLGDRGHYGVRAAVAAGMPPERAHAFLSLQEAAEFLKKELRSNDLVLLRGRNADHNSRLYFAQLGTLACWKVNCGKTKLCDYCPELGAKPQAAVDDTRGHSTSASARPAAR
jgi:hypothetical protein